MKKILACDLDGTLIEYPYLRRITWNTLRVSLLGAVTWLNPRLQLRWARPTSAYQKIKRSGTDFVVISGRTEFLSEPYRTITELLDYQPQEILLRDGNSNRFEHKIKALQKLGEKYEVIAFVEDETKAQRILRKSEKVKVPIIPPDPEQIEKLNL